MKKITLLVMLLLSLALFASCGTGKSEPSDSEETVAQTEETLVASDYSEANNWLNLPTESEYDVDIIYFYPTTYQPQGEDGRYATIDNEGMRSGAANVYQHQATAFETVGNIYAPFYRQCDAMVMVGLNQKEMMDMERNVPRVDVFAALDYYFENYNQDRPFILAGHSQGAMMTALVLEEYMKENPEKYENMIAAYMIGFAPTKTWLEDNPHIKFAQGADDVGVSISWNTENPDNLDQESVVVQEGAVCINPLNWRTDETYAGVSENKGSLITDEEGNTSVGQGIADACIDLERGSLICKSVDPEIYANKNVSLFGPGSYHSWDYDFYYENIRENAALRAKTFLMMQ